MSETHTVLTHWTAKRWEEAGELAAANYPDGRNKMGGNVKELIEHLIFQAYRDPARFGLRDPNDPGQDAERQPSVSEEFAAKRSTEP